MQDIHRVDDHRAVGGVLAYGISELLNGLEGMIIQRFLPRVHIIGCPIPIDAADGHLSVAARLYEHLREQGRLSVVTVYEDRDLSSQRRELFVCHAVIILYVPIAKEQVY